MNAPGTLFLVVGPSGSGKDTLMDGARAALAGDPAWVFARRHITRPEQAGGEPHIAVSEAEFARAAAAGAFLVSWQSHGLSYGLAMALRDDLLAGRSVIANVSRTVIGALAAALPRVEVIVVTAPVEVRAGRLAGRGRETEADIAARLRREVPDPPPGVPTSTVLNDADRETGIARFLACLRAA